MPKRKKAKVEGPGQARSSGGRPRKQPTAVLPPAQPAESAMEDLETQKVDLQLSNVPAARKPKRAGVGASPSSELGPVGELRPAESASSSHSGPESDPRVRLPATQLEPGPFPSAAPIAAAADAAQAPRPHKPLRDDLREANPTADHSQPPFAPSDERPVGLFGSRAAAEACEAAFWLSCEQQAVANSDHDSGDEEREDQSRLRYNQALRKLKRTFPEMRQQLDPVLEGRLQLRPCPCCGEGWLPRWPWTPQHGLGFCECKLAEDEWDSWHDEWETAGRGL